MLTEQQEAGGYRAENQSLPDKVRMHDKGLLQPGQQVLDGRARRVYDITPSGLAVLERHQSDLHRDETTARE